MNRSEYGKTAYGSRAVRENTGSGKSLYEILLDWCCVIVAFFSRPAVRWTVRFITGAGVTAGVFFLARAMLGGTIGWISAILVAAAITAVGCIGIKED